MDEVLARALTEQPEAIEWSEADRPAPAAVDENDVEPVITH
jgi:hypothetical protein